jgi:hypothetical protein
MFTVQPELPTLGRTLRPAWRKIQPLRKKFGPVIKAFVLETQKLSLSMSVAKVCYFLNLPSIRVNKEVRLLFGPVPKSAKIPKFGSRFVRQLHFTFYSALFDSCGRTIGQLATLCTMPSVLGNVLSGLGRWRFGMVNDNLF